MSEWIMRAFQLALEGSAVLLAVMLLRFLLKKAPKKYICFLWAAALLRLCLPYLPQGPIPAFWRSAETVNVAEVAGAGIFSSQISLEGQADTAEMEVSSSQTSREGQTDPSVGQNMAGDIYLPEVDPGQYWLTQSDYFADIKGNVPEKAAGSEGDKPENVMEYYADKPVGAPAADKAEIISPEDKAAISVNSAAAAAILWLSGAVLLLVILVGKYSSIRRKLREALPEETFRAYPVKSLSLEGLPAVFGIIRPCIYVPAAYEKWDEEQKELILLHEATHIRRGDHLLKLFSVIVLCIYWWNPLVWLSVKLLHRDIEMACDEGVLAAIDGDGREAYAKVLLYYAAGKNGIILPTAFAESDAEGRIKNILHYRKVPVALTIVSVAVVLAAVICIVTRPRDVAQKAPDSSFETLDSQPGIPEETGATSDSRPDKEELSDDQQFKNVTWPEESQAYWTERLSAEGKLKNLDKDLHFFFYWGDPETDERGVYQQVQCLAVLLEEDGVVELYRSAAESMLNADGTVTTSELVHEKLGDIDNREALLQLVLLPFLQYINDVEWPEQSTALIAEIGSRMQTKASERYARLQNPVTAAEELLHLQGGTGSFARNSYDGGHLEYTFADGSSAYIYMYRREGIWCPSFVEDVYWERDPGRRERDLTWIENCRMMNSYMETVTAAELRKSTEAYDVGYFQEKWYEYDTRTIILDEMKEQDAVLYGLYGGDHMVLRVKDSVVPIWVNWVSPHMIMPTLFCGDYDNDGRTEYAVRTHLKTGTGCSGDQLYIIELKGDDYTVSTYSEEERMKALAGINYDYREQYSEVKVIEENGREVSLYLQKMLDELGNDGRPAAFKGLSFGDIESFLEVDGQWYYAVEGGVLTDTVGPVIYECGFRMICPVLYSEEAGFSLGKMQFAPYYYNDAIQAAIDPLPEKVLNVWEADLTHDGVKEEIVVSVTCIDEESEQETDFEKLLQRGELCHVRVYNVEPGAYDKDAWAKTGGYCTSAARWSNRELSNAAEGTGMVYLVHRDGKDYLMSANAVMWQGVLEANYSVVQITGEYAYTVDSAELLVDFNSDRAEEIEEALDVEAMVTFTEKWNAWTKDGRLLVRTAHEGSVCAHNNEKFDAWKIWEEIVEMSYTDAALFEGAPKQVALKDMHSLRDALGCMKESRVYWAHCIHGDGEDTGHQGSGHNNSGHHQDSHH